MKQRIREVHKIGNGKYYTSSSTIGEYLFSRIIYYCIIYPVYLLYKYLILFVFVKPIKYIINKFKNNNK